jgi:pimeloyl-ACP methyl ester carboxylesterase
MSSLETFDHDGFTFDVDDSGGVGEPVVLLHGFPETRGSWNAVTPHLVDAGYRVLAPDQRGYSPRARPRGRRCYAMGHLVGDLMALADTAGLDRFHLVGHDWGGAVAWSAAVSHPERLLTVTSLATPHPTALAKAMVSSSQPLRSWYMLFYQLPWVPEASVTSHWGGKAFFRVLVKSGLSVGRADQYVRFLRSGAAGPAINWYRALPFISPQGFRKVSVPALYVYGDGDQFLGRRAAGLTGDYTSGPYRYEVLAGVSHWMPEEAAAEVSRLLLEHLAAHPLVL